IAPPESGAQCSRRFHRDELFAVTLDYLVDFEAELLPRFLHLGRVQRQASVSSVDSPERRPRFRPVELDVGVRAFERGIKISPAPALVKPPQNLRVLVGHCDSFAPVCCISPTAPLRS